MMFQPLGHSILSSFWLVQFLNIAIIAILARMLLKYLWNTSAMPVIGMFLVIIIVANVLGSLGFHTFSFLLSSLTPILFIAVVVIFHEEIKDVLGTMGRNIRRKIFETEVIERSDIESLVESCTFLRKLHLGGLFVMERKESVENICADAINLDRLRIDPPVVAAILQPPGFLHDGAVIISNGRIIAARAFLPLSRETFYGKSRSDRVSAVLGTRHRAAIGITEVSDAIGVVVSEETGHFSITHDGRIEQNLMTDELVERLVELTSKREEE